MSDFLIDAPDAICCAILDQQTDKITRLHVTRKICCSNYLKNMSDLCFDFSKKTPHRIWFDLSSVVEFHDEAARLRALKQFCKIAECDWAREMAEAEECGE